MTHHTLSGPVATTLDTIDRGLNLVEKSLVMFAAATAGFVMCVVSADALGRYFFNSPLAFTIEMVSRFLLPIIMLLVASRVLRKGDHISVDLFAEMMPKRLYYLCMSLGMLASAAVVWIMLAEAAEKALTDFERGKTSFGIIPWPLWVEPAIYSVCLLVLFARLLHIAGTNIAATATGDPAYALSRPHTHETPEQETL